MYGNRKGPGRTSPQCPRDAQAREKSVWHVFYLHAHSTCRLAIFVYEYLLHQNAKQAAETFLKEVRFIATTVGFSRVKDGIDPAEDSSILPRLINILPFLLISNTQPESNLQINWKPSVAISISEQSPGFLHQWWWLVCRI